MNRFLPTLIFLLVALFSGAQATGPAMADPMRENGKIYVVIGVIAVIFVSIALFLVYIERRLTRLERRLNVRKENKENK
jgi:hypothetical protein